MLETSYLKKEVKLEVSRGRTGERVCTVGGAVKPRAEDDRVQYTGVSVFGSALVAVSICRGRWVRLSLRKKRSFHAKTQPAVVGIPRELSYRDTLGT